MSSSMFLLVSFFLHIWVLYKTCLSFTHKLQSITTCDATVLIHNKEAMIGELLLDDSYISWMSSVPRNRLLSVYFIAHVI